MDENLRKEVLTEEAERVLEEDRMTVTGRKIGYVPRAAENETAVIENQGNLGTAPLTEPDELAEPEEVPLLTYAKSPCFGDCDVYRLDVMPDGRMTLEVELGFSRPGTYVQTLTAFDRMDLMGSLDSLRGVAYEPVYPTDPEAIPDDGSYTAVTLPGEDGEARSITVYYDAPEELDRFMRRVRQLIEDQAWSPRPR
jgi:hypothetical protein